MSEDDQEQPKIAKGFTRRDFLKIAGATVLRAGLGPWGSRSSEYRGQNEHENYRAIADLLDAVSTGEGNTPENRAILATEFTSTEQIMQYMENDQLYEFAIGSTNKSGSHALLTISSESAIMQTEGDGDAVPVSTESASARNYYIKFNKENGSLPDVWKGKFDTMPVYFDDGVEITYKLPASELIGIIGGLSTHNGEVLAIPIDENSFLDIKLSSFKVDPNIIPNYNEVLEGLSQPRFYLESDPVDAESVQVSANSTPGRHTAQTPQTEDRPQAVLDKGKLRRARPFSDASADLDIFLSPGGSRYHAFFNLNTSAFSPEQLSIFLSPPDSMLLSVTDNDFGIFYRGDPNETNQLYGMVLTGAVAAIANPYSYRQNQFV